MKYVMFYEMAAEGMAKAQANMPDTRLISGSSSRTAAQMTADDDPFRPPTDLEIDEAEEKLGVKLHSRGEWHLN